MTTDQGAAHGLLLPAVPPEWVPLADLPGWIARRYGVSGDAVATSLILAVRREVSLLRHRIPGIEARFGRSGIQVLPPGLDWKRAWGGNKVAEDGIVVTHWEAAKADWSNGTVGGWEWDGTRERLQIEVLWASVEELAVFWVQKWKRETSEVPAVEAAAPKRGGGRPANPHWVTVIPKLRKRLEDDGAPADGDGGQAKLERFVAE